MAVSNTADLFFSLFNVFTFLAVLVGAFVLGLMAYLLLHFRARATSSEPDDAPSFSKLPAPRGELKTVIISVSLSAIILGVLVVGTFSTIDQINSPPAQCSQTPSPCLTINVFAHRFYWNFTYPGGHTVVATTADSSVPVPVPKGTVVILRITSSDVFHSFGILDFRIKTDAIPGRTNTIWFVANDVGDYTIQCFELCGTGHAFMKATLRVMQPGDFAASYSGY